MLPGIQEELLSIHKQHLLDRLLADKTTKSNIIWATDAYNALGDAYRRDKEITPELITGANSGVIKNRARKALEQQAERTKQHAEVFTPLWVCEKMNDYIDEVWFDRKQGIRKTDPETGHILFTTNKKWRYYVDSRRLEITCGEAPYLVSRYDVSTAEAIPIEQRIGILDRKLQAINENAATEAEWIEWAIRAFQATYGYEFQGDNVLIARVNLLMTFEEYLYDRWKRKPTEKEYQTITNIICWNIWQMDGLSGTIPYCKAEEDEPQIDIFSLLGEEPEDRNAGNTQPKCRVFDWRRENSVEFQMLNKGERKMKFDFIIGNPPFMEQTDSNSTRMPPIYNYFMDAAYDLSDRVELITPARFLFNAGYTPKAWNEKMLNDPHFRILYYESTAAKVFSGKDIKGGVAISYRDKSQYFGAIEIFTKYSELNEILQKVRAICGPEDYLERIINSPLNFQVSDLMKKENPDLVDRLRTSAFTALAKVFHEEKPNDGHDYVEMIGLISNKRARRFIRRDYLRESGETLDKYTLLLSKANGAGDFGEVLSPPIVAGKGVAYTQTFIGIGAFDQEDEAKNVHKYIRTKFARAMLGILKITQDCPGPKWKYVPLQDFTSASDIDWSKPIPEIDRQLYAKYGLDAKEIEFIETHVKEMA